MYEMIGTVKKVSETVTNERGYSHRDLVVEEPANGHRPNVVQFAFQGEHGARLDGLAAGMRVKVGFVVNGWEWTQPSGEVKVCSKLLGIEAVRLVEGETAQPAIAPAASMPAAPEPPLPF